MEEDNHHPLPAEFDPLLRGILGCFAGVFIVAAYHFMATRCISHSRSAEDESQVNRPEQWPRTSDGNSALLPTYRHVGHRKVDGTCAVCLSEFADGEMIRVLPECLHSFHAPCIDMWLYTHSSCPLCRANTRLLPLANLPTRFVPSSSHSTEARLPITPAPATPQVRSSENTSPGPVTVPITGTSASDIPHGDNERTPPGPLPTNASHSGESSQRTPMSSPTTSVTIPLTYYGDHPDSDSNASTVHASI